MTDRRIPQPRRGPTDRRADDRRHERRAGIRAAIRLLRSGPGAGDVLMGELVDVSANGVRLLLDRPLPPAESLLIEVRDADGGCCNLTARVVWAEPADDDRHAIGCELPLDLSAAQLNQLRQIAQ